jgi:glycine cleavage system aminomethyltransferase T
MVHLNRELADEGDVEAVHETLDHTIIGLDGPYAWELMSLLVGPEVVGLPYLTFFRTNGILCYRAGKTGEFGYRLVVPDDMLEEMSHRLKDLGAPLDLGSASLEALDQCALDNWFFNVRGEGRHGPSPIELQLQWRVSYQKSFVGSDALAAHRSEGIRQRLTCIVCEGSLETGDAVTLDATRVGTVANAAFSPIRDQWVALALLNLDHAYPGIDGLRIGSNGATGITVSPPVLDNRSLYVNPQIHSYQSRDEFDFPPVRPT